LVPNPNWWGESKPKLTKITLLMITDAAAEYAAYLAGELDAVNVPPSNRPAVLTDAKLSKELVRVPELVTFGAQFNVKSAPFDNKQVRQAFATAFDRKTFVDNILKGVGQPAYSWIPPGMPGYDPEAGKQYTFDAAKAKKLLADAGFPDGKGLPKVKFTFADTAANKLNAEFLQAQIKDNLGVAIDLDPMEPKSFTAYVNEEKHQWAWFGWGADYPDPDNWLPELWGCAGGNNHTNYCSEKFEELAKKAANELNEKTRLDLWAQAHKLVLDDAPIVLTHHRERFWLVKPYVKDFIPTAMDGQIPGDRFFTTTSITPH
jgi:oligopeptide transport system substrate-binding protein